MTLETPRLGLPPVNDGDLEAWANLLANPRATRLLHVPEPHTREHVDRS